MFSEPTEDCYYHFGKCISHAPTDMLQVMSLTLVHAPVSNGSMQLYGYVAVRDERDWMLNYIFNNSRDDPIVVQQVHFYTYLQSFLVSHVLFFLQ